MKNVKIANIKTSFKDFFYKWLYITSPFHKLGGQELSVLALFLYYFYVYKKDIKNDDLVWKILFDYETKQKIKEELNIKDSVFQNIMSNYRKKKIITGNKINSIYIPNINFEEPSYRIIYNFIIDA